MRILAVIVTIVVSAASFAVARGHVADTCCVASDGAAEQASSAVTLSVDGRSSSTPWIAASGSFVVAAWGASAPPGGTDVFIAVSRDGGASFAAPVRVNARAGQARLGGELPPRVALADTIAGRDPAIVVVWGARTPSTAILRARSDDGGRTFSLAESLSKAESAGDRGWHSLAVSAAGQSHVVWLDHRGLANQPKGDHAQHQSTDGAAMAQKSGLYYASSTGDERELTPGVCYCCKTAMAVAGSNIYIAWRHVYPGNLRDIAFTRSQDGGRTFSAPVRVSADNWQLAGCPDDGPAMAVDAAGTVHLIWPTVVSGAQPSGALFYSSTRDGVRFTPRVRVPTLGSPKPSHPQILAADGGRLIVAWDEAVEGVRRAVARTMKVESSGVGFGSELVLDAGAPTPSSYPVLAWSSRGLLAITTVGVNPSASVVVRQLTLPLPAATVQR